MLLPLAGLALIFAGCTAGAGTPTAPPSIGGSSVIKTQTPSATAVVVASPSGLLSAGTYSTTAFTPSITYTVPDDGWANLGDRSGNFLLVPPGESLAGVHADTSEFVGVYRGVGA